MKVNATEEELSTLNERVYRVGAQAAVISTISSSLGVYALNKYNPWFNRLRTSFKSAAWVLPIVFATVVSAEEQVLAMERERHSLYDLEGVESKKLQDKELAAQQEDWMTWLADNRFTLVASAWVVGVAGSLAMNYSNPYISPTVKAFHARVQSQAITLGALVAAGAVAPFGSKKSGTSDMDMFNRRLAFEEKKWALAHNGSSPV
eukprot:CFRG3692T1